MGQGVEYPGLSGMTVSVLLDEPAYPGGQVPWFHTRDISGRFFVEYNLPYIGLPRSAFDTGIVQNAV